MTVFAMSRLTPQHVATATVRKNTGTSGQNSDESRGKRPKVDVPSFPSLPGGPGPTKDGQGGGVAALTSAVAFPPGDRSASSVVGQGGGVASLTSPSSSSVGPGGGVAAPASTSSSAVVDSGGTKCRKLETGHPDHLTCSSKLDPSVLPTEPPRLLTEMGTTSSRSSVSLFELARELATVKSDLSLTRDECLRREVVNSV